MTLKSYVKKRRLDQTPEPKARLKNPSEQRAFVVQKHHASHLHYDLRLELDGVLKSWAVPKGPPKTPDEKRLAIRVEDHPYDYKDFEGTIPAGHYGAGEVLIWDEGNYVIPDINDTKQADAYLRAGLKKGHISFVLQGNKLKGEYSLIRTALPGAKEQWLWIKKGVLKSPRPDKMPKDPRPMLAGLRDEAFNNKDWIFEIKWDGYRCLAVIKPPKVTLYSRNLKSFNVQFESIALELKTHIKKKAILDGEIVVLNEEGRSVFDLLQNYGPENKDQLYYYVFDLLYLDGHDIREKPLIERKELLEHLLAPLRKTHIRYTEHIEEQGKKLFNSAKKLGLEGIIAKDKDSAYVMRRSESWLKIKSSMHQEVYIGGFTKPQGCREEFGALLVGINTDQGFRYVGRVGTGFDAKMLHMVAKKLKPLVKKSSPFINKPTSTMPITFVEPKVACRVSFSEWTKSGLMRHPVFVELSGT